MASFKKKIPPPPKEPGTHTNAEVKEALHARALRRTILITAVVFLLLACLAVMSNSARLAVGSTGKPKLFMIVAEGLSPTTYAHAMQSNKAPFTRVINSLGGVYSSISASYPSESNKLVNLLTGSSSKVGNTLSGTQSILGWLRAKKKHVVVAAPASGWSVGTQTSGNCSHVGLYDTECSNQACPTETAAAYCNAYRKYVTCNDRAQLYQDEIPRALEKAVNLSADAVYFHLSAITEAAEDDLEASVQERSEVNLLDAAIGRVTMALALRTAETAENWLLIVTSDGNNAEASAPLVVAAYTEGELVQLNPVDPLSKNATTADVFSTVKEWFGEAEVDRSRLLGICSNGVGVKNCQTSS